jgi:replicative DNA helicase
MRPVNNTSNCRGDISEACNASLEASLLGAPPWLLSEDHEEQAVAVMRYITRQRQEIFVKHIHRCLWECYESLAMRDLPPTEAWIEQEARKLNCWSPDENSKGLITAGWLDELREQGSCRHHLKLGEPALTMAREVVSELSELFRRRQTIHGVQELYSKVTENWHGPAEAEIAELIETVQFAFNSRPKQSETAVLVSTLVQQDIQELERQITGEIVPPTIKTGFTSLDRILGGLLPGNLAICAARPGAGKTSLALDVALAAAHEDHFTLFCSFEMTRRELTRRIVSKKAKIDVLRLRHGDIEWWQLDLIKQIFGPSSSLELVLDEANYTPRTLEARIREFNRLINPGTVELVVIDHIQLMGTRDTTRYERRDRQLAEYSGQLKDMAKRLGLTVLCLSQLNRQSENRPLEQRAPRLSDLRESGSLEQDGDVILGLHRRFLDTQDPTDAHHAELRVLKNRSGPTGLVRLQWVPHLAKFTSPDEPI